MRRESIKERWAHGQFTAAFDIEMMAKNAAGTATCSILEDLINLEYEDLMTEIESGE